MKKKWEQRNRIFIHFIKLSKTTGTTFKISKNRRPARKRGVLNFFMN